MVRAFVLYAEQPDPDTYAEHVELCRRVSGATFRHGPIFGSPTRELRYRYYAEFEFPDMESFRKVAASPEFAASGKDAAGMGIPFSVHFAEIE